MSSEKKLEIKRVVIFCILSVLPGTIAVAAIYAVHGKPIFASEDMAAIAYVVAGLGMMAPAVANVFTRFLTKEGFKDSYLSLNFKKNEWYYVASVGVKLIETALMFGIIWLVFFKNLNAEEFFAADLISERWAIVVSQVGFSIVLFLPAFGEEFGWRGYLMPKLMKLMGKPMAIVAGGVIWGLWHAPFTVNGHNFGVDYPGFPWLGMLIMCTYCILVNAFLTLLTERTKSVYPAAFAHMVNNNVSVGVVLQVLCTEAVAEELSAMGPLSLFGIMIGVVAVTGVVSFVLLMSGERKGEKRL